MILSKCIGIISYFPDDIIKRNNRIRCFEKLLKVLEIYFKIPIVIIAQNWKDYNINYLYGSTIYRFDRGLGITAARITLREKLLQNHDYDYYIWLDDDTDITCTYQGIAEYFKQIDDHPDMIGSFSSVWFRLFAISKSCLEITNFDYIKDYDPCRGEIWEDVAWHMVWKKIYPEKFFNFKVKGLTEKFTPTERDPNSTWYRKNFTNLYNKTKILGEKWYKSLT